jgi:hypothetical protein
VNSALWELLLSAVLVLEIPALVSSLILGIAALHMDDRPRTRWVLLAMGVGLSIPWAGAVLGLLLGVLLSLVFDAIWIPLLAGLTIGVLYLQIRWTQLILAEWGEPSGSEESEPSGSEESEPEVEAAEMEAAEEEAAEMEAAEEEAAEMERFEEADPSEEGG